MRVVVHSAAIQDRDGAGLVLDTVRRRFPWLELIWADGACNPWYVEAAAGRARAAHGSCQPEQAPGRILGRKSMQAGGIVPGGIVVERDLMVPARDGVMLATDIYRPEGSGPFPVLLERTPYDKSAPSRSERTAADPTPRSRAGGRRLFRRARLCGRLSGLPRPLSLGRQLHEIPQRGRGRRRHARLADASELVRRKYRHVRPVLCGAHAGGARLSRSAGSEGAVPRLRRLLERLSQRHPPRRRVRPEAGDLGLSQRAGRCARPGDPRGARGAGHRRLVPPDAVDAGGIRRSAPPPNTRTTCSSSGRTAPSTITGSSPASMPRGFTTATPRSRSCICRAGTTRTRAPRPRTMSACREPGAARSA